MSLEKTSQLLNKVATIVLAGGQGTRLYPLTKSRCKPSVSFGGRYRLIDIPLSNSLNSRIENVFVISQYFTSSLHDHILSTYQKGGISLLSPKEEEGKPTVYFTGTADAVRKNMQKILSAPADYFLILSGDQLYNIDFSQMLQFAIDKEADLVIASLPVEAPEAKRMGLLKIDDSCHVVDFFEKPSDPAILKRFELPTQKFLGSMGIYIFTRNALIAALEEEGEDFGKEIIPREVKRGKTAAFIYDGYWEDIGTISSFYLANLALTKQKSCLETYDEKYPIYTHSRHLPCSMIKNGSIKHSLISEGAIIEADEISNSIVGIRTRVKRGTTVRDSVILGNHGNSPYFEIGEDCLIQKAIIDEQTHIGNRVQLTNKSCLQTYDGDGIYIRDGIIIVTTGTRLPDDFVL